jgi:CheY-like chemotaxis protein
MLSNKRVLCVDDNVDTCALVQAVLGDWEVITEFSSAEGLRRAATEEFDLILLDYYLPDGTGLKLCEQIRAFDMFTPILMVTATHSLEHRQAVKAGGQGVIRKDHLTHLLPAALALALELKHNP